MSTSTLLYSIQRNLFRIGGPILIVIGSISCILNLMVFMKKTLRKNPCTICFITVNIVNLLYFYLGFIFLILPFGYDIDYGSNNIAFCRFRLYIALVLAFWEPSCLILASIDRTLITSFNAGTRRLSTRRLIVISIVSIGLFWMVISSHTLIFGEILQYGPDYFVCFYQPGIYTTFMSYYAFILNGCFPTVLMVIFGHWTMKNIHRMLRIQHQSGLTNTGTAVVVGRSYTLQSKDQQLTRMLYIDIIFYVICKCSVPIFFVYQQITQFENKSVEQQLIEQSILQIIYFVFFIENSLGCYTNILISKTFRAELKRIFLNVRHLCFRYVH